MKYKVSNSLTDMKLLRDGKCFVIKRGTTEIVSQAEYQLLGQVYGLSVKGEKVIEVRITKPARILEVKEDTVEADLVKKPKRRKR